MSHAMISSFSEYIYETLRWGTKKEKNVNEELLQAQSNEQIEDESKLNEDVIYHAVYVPWESDEKTQDNLHVYLDQSKALMVMKEHQNSRFKSFKNRSDAVKFALHGYEQSCLTSPTLFSVNLEEKLTNFKEPKSQHLVAFRKLIERNKLDEVKHTMWNNPRYLVSNCDTPTILQEGSRYNALHVAVRSAETLEMCELILNTVGSTEFVQLLYGEDECKTYVNQTQILLDRYLNTPDKGLNETPLHFAVKFGLKDIVQLLVSYSQCLKTLPNKFNQKPIDLICSRKHSEDEVLKKDIYNLLQKQYYVPVLRSVDNTLQPRIGEPFSPTDPPRLNIDPISPPVEVRAFAGPMTKEQAFDFRKKWKTPPRNSGVRTPNRLSSQQENSFNVMHSPVLNISCRLQDTEKGLERVGRDLAEECRVSWKEYWSFLNGFADLRCTEDLMKVEKYLKSRFQMCEKLPVIREDAHNTPVDEIDKLCEAFGAAVLSDDENDKDNEYVKSDDTFFTPPSSPVITDEDSDDDMYIAEEGLIIFIEGDTATKLDYAVFNAIPPIIKSHEFPYIYLWRHAMQLLIKENPHRFDNNTPIRRRLHLTPEKSRKFNLIPHKIHFNDD